MKTQWGKPKPFLKPFILHVNPLFVFGAIAALVVAGSAQQSPQQRPPVFRGKAVLVTVDVYPQRTVSSSDD